jgi:flagellar biosynthesis protein FlhG
VQAAQISKDSETSLPRVIAISSGKGGVGKSSIAVNIGISLAKTGAKVCLLDADTGLANANILLGLTPEFSLEHVLYGAKPIEEVMLDGPHGLKIIPGANGISECVSLHPRQQLRLTRELSRIEGDFDFLLIDTAAGIAETTLDFISAAHHTLVVITPEPTSLTDAFSLIKLLKRRRSKLQFHVVVNMCSSISQAKEVFNRFRAAVDKYIGVQSDYLGYLRRDESMRVAVELQNPVTMFADTPLIWIKSHERCRMQSLLADIGSDNFETGAQVLIYRISAVGLMGRQKRKISKLEIAITLPSCDLEPCC